VSWPQAIAPGEKMLSKIIDLFQYVDKPILLFQKYIVIVFGTFMATAMTWTIISRLIFKNSLLGLEEIILITAIWFYMLGATIASSERSHIKVDIISMFIKNKKILTVIQVLISAFVLIVAIIICQLSFDLLSWALEKKTALPATRIPSAVPQSAFAISTVLFIFYFLRDLVMDIASAAKAFTSSPDCGR
jgi:TRAP-type C4-dicarboxylate transport system permease small subunit